MSNSNIETYRLGKGGVTGVLRIGAVRYLPRGIRKEDYSRLGYFDIWLPQLSPSKELLKEYKTASDTAAAWKSFATAYRKEIGSNSDARQLIKFIALISGKIPVALGCYCEDPSMCHRSILKGFIEEAEEK